MAELSIAIADDNRQTLNLLGEILEKEDGIHVVGKADNGEDAYNMIVRTNPDIVLMDVIMPRLGFFRNHPFFASNEIISVIKYWYQIKAVYDNEE